MGKLHTIYDAKLKTGLMRRMDFGSRDLITRMVFGGGPYKEGTTSKMMPE
jgi:hypothetical protein